MNPIRKYYDTIADNGGGDAQEKDNRQWGGESLEDFEEDKRIFDEAKTSAKIIDWFEVWCYKTKRSGGILITSSIKEVLTDFYNDNIQPKTNETYNTAIQDAIELFEKYWQYGVDEVTESNAKEFLQFLSQLKKEVK